MMLPLKIVLDKNLSTRSKGLYALIKHLQEAGLNVSQRLISQYVTEGRTAIEVSIRELKEHGYLDVIQERNNSGRISYFYKLK